MSGAGRIPPLGALSSPAPPGGAGAGAFFGGGTRRVTDVVIVSAARTPVGAFSGALSTVPAHYLGQVAVQAALERAKVEAAEVSEVILGQILTAGQGQNPARQASINAGVPKEVPAYGV